MTNAEIATLLRKVAAAYQVLGENRFKVIAYERAADSIDHATSELKDLWDDGKLGEVPGVGAALSQHLGELFRTGHVRHFESVLAKLPPALFPLLLVPGLGPKKAYKLVTELKLNSEKTVFADLLAAAKAHKIAAMEGFGEKSEADIVGGIASYQKGQIKEKRMPLPLADSVAQEVITHIKQAPATGAIDVLGSLRRKVATIGDIDIAVATTKPEAVIEQFVTFPHQKLIERGPAGASLLLHNGRQVDLRVQKPEAYGAMLQYFTGSKNHNIRLRAYALEKGLSLNEYGIKHVKTQKTALYATEELFYKALGLPWIPPELREDKGEIEASLRSAQGKPAGLPPLVELGDIHGDLHMHTSYDLKPSHDLGANTLAEHLDKAAALGYAYIGLSDHNPSVGNQSEEKIIDIMKRRKAYYEHQYSSWEKRTHPPAGGRVHMFIMCEVDIQPDGKLALPQKAFDWVDAVIVSLHAAFGQDRAHMTKRILTALGAHPKVRIFGHPTGRLLGSREGVDADWPKIFAFCHDHQIALEINAAPERLDLPDTLVYDAVRAHVPLCIDTDAHAVPSMELMGYGVSVARRGWATKHDIVNTLGYNEFTTWLKKGA